VFETNIVVIGNVLTAPEWRRTPGNHLVANFRIASTSRRFDRESGRWVDGDHLRIRVTCWRRLAENVGASLALGDPVVVVGKIYTRDWTDTEGNPRISYEMEAIAVGHDLARGKSKFFRARAMSTVTSETDDPEAGGMVRGEAAGLVPDDLTPIEYGDGMPVDVEEPEFDQMPDGDVSPGVGVMGITSPSQVTDDAEAVLAPSLDKPAEPRTRRRSRREPAIV
jgi:single-strand DNA-binding protein